MKLHFSFRISIHILFVLAIASCSEDKSEKGKDLADSAKIIDSVKRDVIVEKVIAPLPLPDTSALELTEQVMAHPNGDTFSLFLPAGFAIRPLAWDLKRVRFMDVSPDERLFVTDMINLADNKIGKVWILEDYNDSNQAFNKKTVYLDKLRNPNSLAFYTDASGKDWLYVALTDKLVRYAYDKGSDKPGSAPEVLDIYPDYGLSYRYGGWHLTRTIQFGDNGKLYVSVGSSCNTCEEKEEVRASVVEMDPDGKNRRVFARGLRNAVGLEWVERNLYATNMAADHFGNDKPDDALFRVDENKNYGWPYYYHWNNQVYPDPKYDTIKTKTGIEKVQVAYSCLGAHTAPLGLAWFGKDRATDPALQNYFIVAQHGSFTPTIGRGYSAACKSRQGAGRFCKGISG